MESLELIYCGHGNIESESMTYFESHKYSTRYVRGLRLWLIKRRGVAAESPQRIGFVFFQPRVVEEGGFFSNNKYERLDQMLAAVNQKLISDPIPGKIKNTSGKFC